MAERGTSGPSIVALQIQLAELGCRAAQIQDEHKQLADIPTNLALLRLRLEHVEGWRTELRGRFWALAITLAGAVLLATAAMAWRFSVLEAGLRHPPPPIVAPYRDAR